MSIEPESKLAPFLEELLLDGVLTDFRDFFLSLRDLDEELVSSEFFDLCDGDPDFDLDDP